jgi:hypothetical protein
LPRHGSRKFTSIGEHNELCYPFSSSLCDATSLTQFIVMSTLSNLNILAKGGMAHSQGPSVTTTLGMSIDPPKVQHHDDEGQLHKKSSNNSNGNYAGGSHKPEANTR